MKSSEAVTIAGIAAVGAFTAYKNGLLPSTIALYGAGAIIVLTAIAYSVDAAGKRIAQIPINIGKSILFFPIYLVDWIINPDREGTIF